MPARMLRDKRILWGSIIMICITLSLLLIQPGSVMLAESARSANQTSVSSSISLKQLQSSSTRIVQGAVENSSAQYASDDTLYPSLTTTPELTATPIPVYIKSFPTKVVPMPTPSPSPTVSASSAALPAVPTPPSQSDVTPTPTAAISPTPLPSPTSPATRKPAVPSPTDP